VVAEGYSDVRLRGSTSRETAHIPSPQRPAGWGTNEDGEDASIDPGGPVLHRPLADAWAV
jgi:hypothetical protein